MNTKINFKRKKAIIAISVAAVLIGLAALAGYALFSPDNAADTALSPTNAVGYSETYNVTETESGTNHSNTNTQIINTRKKGTDLTDFTEYNTAAKAEQKPPTSYSAKPQSTGKLIQTMPQSRCNIEIICKNAAEYAKNHPSVVLSGKAMSGVILQSTAVEISDSDTAFDVLKRVCTENNISLEFTKTPLYNSYYIEGIGGLYEFDCGSSSGWIYSVNGEKPNRSSSEYRLNDGDKIVFAYTLKNGADI